jgi:uncharacterized glyoxalase superfamily protein PhnB
MNLTGITPILNVRSIAESVAWFAKLGWKLGFAWGPSGMIATTSDPAALDAASFGCVCAGEGEIFLSKDGQGGRDAPDFEVPAGASDETSGSGVWLSLWLKTPAEVDAAHALAVSHGMTITSPPRSEPWGAREFHLRHPDGHTFRVGASTGEPSTGTKSSS